MAKQLNVSLNFAANTSQAKSELKSLQQDLYQIINMSGGKIGLTADLREAKNAAKELSYHLNQAYNSSTGNIDLSKLNDSLQRSSTNVTQLSNKLLQAGSSGQSAFINLAKAISQADYPMFKLNSRLAEMWTTLKNTARWQLSSSVLHGFMGAIQQAVSYAKDLDESLNNIRIVTNMTSEGMDLFAEKANKAAKALNTTTTAYTNAALIFYQQGLDSKEVEERTNTVIKMANVTGDNATEVSSYMTAIWNNFDDGSESLEHYADVITALGASTASSSAEIAAGLEKFASVAETIGLSYNYSTAALATIVANTRQSADTVGTGLRTIFSRLQGLSLGETLDDGTDLNKYSKALKTVGVDILDASGKMKDMDTILTDLAGKWDSLSQAQQTALAQTVGGVRQYTNLIALMNNWDDMEENLKTAGNAEGSLQSQADIYADSWEAARVKVDAAAEGIYNSLINRNLLKDFNLILADILTGVDNLIDGFGGLKGVLSAVGSFALSLISHKIQPAIQGLVNNVKNLFISTQTQARQLVQEFQAKNSEQINSGKYDTEQVQVLKNTNILSEARARLTVASKQLTNQEMQLYQQDIQFIETSAKKAETIAASVTVLQNQTEQMINDINVTESNSEANRVYNEMLKERIALTEDLYSKAMGKTGTDQDFDSYIESEQAMDRLIDTKERLDMATNDLVGSIMSEIYACRGSESAMAELGEDVSQLKDKTLNVSGTFAQFINNLYIPQGSTESIDSYRASIELMYKSMPKVIKQSSEVKKALKNIYDASDAKAFNAALKQMQTAIEGVKISGKDLNKIVKELNPKTYKEFESILRRLAKEEENLVKAQEELNRALVGFNPQHFVTGTERVTALASAMGQVAMMGQSISSMIAAWTNEDLSFGEQLTTTFMSLSMLIPGVISSFNSLKTVLSGTTIAMALQDYALKKMGFSQDEIIAKNTLLELAKKKELTSDAAMVASKTLLIGISRAYGISLDDETAALVQAKIVEEMKNGATLEAAIVTALSTVKTKAGTAVTDKDTASKIANKIATDGLSASIKGLLGPIGLVIAAVTGLIAILSALNKIEKQREQNGREERAEQAEQILEQAKAYKTTRQEYEALLETYNKAIANKDKTAAAQQAIADATWDLCEALGIEINYLDRLQGKTQGYDWKIHEQLASEAMDQIKDYDQKLLDSRIYDSYGDITDVRDSLIPDEKAFAAQNQIAPAKYGAFGIEAEISGAGMAYVPDYGLAIGGVDQDDPKVIQALEAYFSSSEFLDKYGDDKVFGFNDFYSGELIFNKDISAEQQYEIIRSAVEYVQKNISQGVRDDSEIYQWYKDLVSEGKSAYNDAIEGKSVIPEAIQDYAIEQTQFENKQLFEEITTTEEYLQMREKLIENIKNGYDQAGLNIEYDTEKFKNEAEYLNYLADQYLSTYDNLIGLQSLDDIAETTGISKDIIEDLYGEYGNLILKVNFDEIQSEEQLRNALKFLQAEADMQEIQVKINTIRTAKDNLSDDMSVDDYATYEETSGIAWGQMDENLGQEIIQYNDFLQMTYEQQLSYLNQLEQAYLTKQSQTIQTALNESKSLLESYNTELEDLQSRKEYGEILTQDDYVRLAQLPALIQETAMGISDLEASWSIINRSILDTCSSLGELQNAFNNITASGGAVNINDYANALIRLGAEFDNCEAESNRLAQALENGDEIQIEAATSALKLSIRAGELAKETGIAAEEIERYAKELKNSGKYTNSSSEALAEMAKDQLRFDRAVTNASENMKDWVKDLEVAQKTGYLVAETAEEMAAAYGDLLDIDGTQLSSSFLNNANNLELMKQALQGNEEAYKRLQEAAREDIAIRVGFDDSEFQSGFAALMQQCEMPPLDQIEIGASLNNEAFLQGLSDMVNAAGMTAQEATDYLSSMGVDAEVISEPEQVKEVQGYNLVPHTKTVSQPYWGAASDGTPRQLKASYPSVSYDVVPVPSTKTVTATSLRVTSASKSSGGKIKHSGSTVANGGSNAPKSSGGGGGGKTEAPEYNEEKHKSTDDEKERYHVIKNQLEDLTSQYDNISKAKDKAFGAARLANLNKEIAAQKKLTQANKDYLREIESYLSDDKAAVMALGANIDENGTITNYDALIQKAVDDYNAAVDAFNRATTDDEGAKKAFEAAQERYDQFMETISQYEETQDLYKDQMQQVLDDIMTEQSLLLERTQLEVELKLNVSEDALNYLEYMMDNIENKAYDCAEAFSYLNGMTQEYFKTAEALEGGLRSLFSNQGLTDEDFQKLIEGDTATYNKLMDMLSSGGTADLSDGLQQSEIDAAYGFTADDVDTIRDYVSQLIEANQNLQEIRQTVHEQILEVWDEWNEKIDDGISKIEHLQSITESYQNIIDIVGQKNLGVSNAFMSKMRQQSVDQANDKLEAEKARYEELKKARDNAYAKYEEQKAKGILSPEEIQLWEDSLKQMDEDVQSAAEDFQSAWEDALTAANEAFEAAVDQIIQAYDDAAAGLMGSMSDLQEAFDRKSDISSQYLADYEKIYQLTKLNRDLENSIDSTSNTKAKAELLELQSKINAYEEAGIDISEYQMEQLRQEYELKKAQIELEESQEAKSQVQMTRDADGNYSYVYTANADDVAKAEQNYEDKLHQMQESNANYINDLQSNMIQMEQDYQDKVQEIMKDTSLTAEERMVKLNELNQYYDEKMKFYMSEAELWEENSQRLYEEDWMNYAAATGYKISSEEEWLDHWNETQLSILTGFGSLEEYQTNHNMNVANLLLSSSDAFATWQTNIEMAMQNAGTSMADFEEDATEVLDTVAEESEETKDSVVNMAEEATDAIAEVVSAVVAWESQYSATVQKMLTWNNALITSFNQLIAGWSAVQSSANSSGAGSGNSSDSGNGSGSGNSGNGSGNNSSSTGTSASVDNSDKVAGVAAAIWLDGDASGWGNNPTRASRLKEKGVEGAQAYINAHGSNGDLYADWASKRGQLRKYYYGSFDTGGYTGEWGLDGKFAMLHEKELVLNKEDTTHFLQAIDIVRQISEMIDLNALSSAGGLSSLLAATASSSSQKLEQQVTIHAEFPNVTDKDQITEAFTDLVNLASQYANRK